MDDNGNKHVDDVVGDDVRWNIENKIRNFINNDSMSISAHRLCFRPLTFQELDGFMNLMRQRYSYKVDISWFYDIQTFTLQFTLQRPL